MKYKKVLIVLAGILVLVASFAIKVILTRTGKSMTIKTDTDEVVICKNYQCKLNSPTYYHYITLENARDKNLISEIDKINEHTKNYVNMIYNGELKGPTCEPVKNIYFYSIYVDAKTNHMINDEYLSICITRVVKNLCDGKIDVVEPDVVNYDIKAKKIMTQPEFKEKFGISDKNINMGIQSELDKINEYNSTNYAISNIKDYKLYLDEEERVICTFYIPELKTYHYAVIEKQ